MSDLGQLGVSLYMCENCGQLGTMASFQGDCTPGWTHGRLKKVRSIQGDDLRGVVPAGSSDACIDPQSHARSDSGASDEHRRNATEDAALASRPAGSAHREISQSVASRAEQKKPRQFPEGKGGEESAQHTAGISPEAVEHIGYLILHRTNPDELRVTLMPDRCPLCREIAAWGLGRG